MDHSTITDRRRLRRKLTFWRAATLVVILAAVAALFASFGDTGTVAGKARPHIARITISGIITDNSELLDRLEAVRKNDNAKAVIIRLSSPGGTSYGGEAVYGAVRKIAADKPVVGDVRTLAASAAYMIACGTDYIVAGDTSIVGSIGVIFQYADVSTLLDKIGISVEEIKSAPLKAEPSPFHPASEEAKAMIDAMITDSYNWFVGLVQERRGLSALEARKLGDGSVFTGRQAAGNGLIDVVGGEAEIRTYLASKQVEEDLDIIDWEERKSGADFFFGGSVDELVTVVRHGVLALPGELKDLADRKLFLDGLVSVWQVGKPEE